MQDTKAERTDRNNAFAKAWKRRQAEQEAILAERKQRMILAAKECAELLKHDYQVTRVVLIGSLTGHTTFHDRSDIDLFVEGLPDPVYFKALNRLYAIAKAHLGEEVDIDLITDDSATKSMLASVDHYGVEL